MRSVGKIIVHVSKIFPEVMRLKYHLEELLPGSKVIARLSFPAKDLVRNRGQPESVDVVISENGLPSTTNTKKLKVLPVEVVTPILFSDKPEEEKAKEIVQKIKEALLK
jgi:nucleotide-binding universal stress UspA family protein